MSADTVSHLRERLKVARRDEEEAYSRLGHALVESFPSWLRGGAWAEWRVAQQAHARILNLLRSELADRARLGAS